MEYAYIERDYEVRDGEVIVTSQWVGRNRLAEVGLGDAVRETGEFRPEFMIGGYLLRVVDKNHGYRLIVTRDPWWMVPIYRTAIRTGKSLEVSWWYFIYILNIWNLATYHPAEIPTWRNIKAIDWLAKRLGK